MLREKLDKHEAVELAELLIAEINMNEDKITERIKLNNHLLQQLLGNLLCKKSSILKYIDLSEISFDGYSVSGYDFSETNAKIDPQKVKDKILIGANLKGLDLSNGNFDHVNIREVNLEGTNAHIDPQEVRDRSLFGSNLRGLDLSEANFDGVNIREANLEGTDAYIDLNSIRDHNIRDTKLNGCTLIGDITLCNTTGAVLDKATILDDYYSRSKKIIKSLFENK